jgi:hypothetical protein
MVFPRAFWVKIGEFFDADGIRDPEFLDSVSGMEKFGSGIRHEHPRSATLVGKIFLCARICTRIRTGTPDKDPRIPSFCVKAVE